MYLRKAPRQGGKPSMQQVRISTAQVLLASCRRATLFWKPRRWSGLHSRSMPITLSVMLSRRAVSASASITETVDTSLSLTCAGAKLGSMACAYGHHLSHRHAALARLPLPRMCRISSRSLLGQVSRTVQGRPPCRLIMQVPITCYITLSGHHKHSESSRQDDCSRGVSWLHEGLLNVRIGAPICQVVCCFRPLMGHGHIKAAPASCPGCFRSAHQRSIDTCCISLHQGVLAE